MTVHDILRIAATVTVTQVTTDFLARRFVFNQESYQRALSTFERAKLKRDKTLATTPPQATATSSAVSKTSAKALEKNAKKIQRVQNDFSDAAAAVAQKHTPSSFLTSILFLILYRVLSTEYSGKVVAVLPFEPWRIVRRITIKGLDISADDLASSDYTDLNRSCSFLFVYMLCTLSLKFVTHKICAVHPPKGADKGVSTFLDTAKSQRLLKSFGVDTEEFNEVRKAVF